MVSRLNGFVSFEFFCLINTSTVAELLNIDTKPSQKKAKKDVHPLQVFHDNVVDKLVATQKKELTSLVSSMQPFVLALHKYLTHKPNIAQDPKKVFRLDLVGVLPSDSVEEHIAATKSVAERASQMQRRLKKYGGGEAMEFIGGKDLTKLEKVDVDSVCLAPSLLLICKLTLAMDKKIGNDPNDNPTEVFSTLRFLSEVFGRACNRAKEYDMWGKGIKKLMEHVFGDCVFFFDDITVIPFLF